MNVILIALGVAGLAYWWLSRRQASPTVAPVAPTGRGRSLTILATLDAIDALKDDVGIAGDEKAIGLLLDLKNIVVEELKK